MLKLLSYYPKQKELATDEECPKMCAYKLVTIKFKWWGLQNKVENFIQKVSASAFWGCVDVGVWAGIAMQFPVAHSQAIPVHFLSQSNHLCLGLLQVGLHWYYQNNSLRKKSKVFRYWLLWFGCCHLGAGTDFNNILHNFQVMWMAELS